MLQPTTNIYEVCHLAGVFSLGALPDVKGAGGEPASVFFSFVNVVLSVSVAFLFSLYGCGPL